MSLSVRVPIRRRPAVPTASVFLTPWSALKTRLCVLLDLLIVRRLVPPSPNAPQPQTTAPHLRSALRAHSSVTTASLAQATLPFASTLLPASHAPRVRYAVTPAYAPIPSSIALRVRLVEGPASSCAPTEAAGPTRRCVRACISATMGKFAALAETARKGSATVRLKSRVRRDMFCARIKSVRRACQNVNLRSIARCRRFGVLMGHALPSPISARHL
mmetsp:Transcript_7625/g.11795  ORF Transcript_7625/g.11795 Transcript_7625/m.11795 type:complete len:217 (+) Transcript_7625:6437-7087(+)